MIFCSKLNIEYLHMPEVGIQSDQRQDLNSQDDYDQLFKIYNNVNLAKTIPSQINILDL